MPQFTEEQILEIQEVLHTLLEATDHFILLVEQKELQQSVQTLTTIVEGMESVFKVLKTSQSDFHTQMKQIEKTLVTIGNLLEKGEMSAIPSIARDKLKAEIIQLTKTEI